MPPQFEHQERIIEFLLQHGAKEVRLVKRGRKHPYIEFTHHGRVRRYFTSLSPSDRRATLKAIADIRRILKEK